MQGRSKPNPSHLAWIFIRKLNLCWDPRFPSRSCWILSPQSKHGKFGLSNKNPPTCFNLAPQCFSQWLNNTEKWLAGHTLGHCGANFKALSASRSAWQGNHKRNCALRDEWNVANHHHHRESMWPMRPMCGIVWPLPEVQLDLSDVHMEDIWRSLIHICIIFVGTWWRDWPSQRSTCVLIFPGTSSSPKFWKIQTSQCWAASTLRRIAN